MAKFQHTVTNLPEEIVYPKLVRDLIPMIIKQNDGVEVPLKVLSDKEFELYLKKKAIEEATELVNADTDSHILEEIADLREILDTLEKFKGFTPEQVRAVQDEKRQKRGAFEKRLLMLGKGEK